MKVRLVEGMKQENTETVCNWTNQRGAAFLQQWAGPALAFPLTAHELDGQNHIYSIFADDEFIGLIQKIRIEKDNVHIGRFLINPDRTGCGFGGYALSEFIKTIFTDLSVNSISLSVSSNNNKAQKLYEKLGFRIYEVINGREKKYRMRKTRD